MKKNTFASLASITLLLTTVSECSIAASDHERPQGPPPSFSDLDTNGDGVISKSETKGPLAQDFDTFDVDGSGDLTEDEMPTGPQH